MPVANAETACAGLSCRGGTPPTGDFKTVVSEFSSRLGDLQAALRECLEAVLPSVDGARACARALGLKRGLGWKAYTIATSPDRPTMLAALPRRPGWNAVLARLRAARCPPKKLRRLTESIEAVLEELDSGRVGMPLPRVLAAGRLEGASGAAEIRRLRRAIRRCLEQIYGVRCRGQVGTWMIGPPDARGRVDLVSSMEFAGLMRLRPGPPVSLKRRGRVSRAHGGPRASGVSLGTQLEKGWLIGDLSVPSGWNEHLRCDETGGDPVAVLESGTSGMKVPIRPVFAECIRRGGTFNRTHRSVDLKFVSSIPVAHVAFEVWMHASFRRLIDPVASLLGSAELAALPTAGPVGWSAVPFLLEAEVTPIDSLALPAPLRAMGAVHAELLRRAAAALGPDLSEFVGFRVALPDPLVGFPVAMRWRMCRGAGG